MPRRARLDIPGALHHIMLRGIDKSDIFKDDQDKSLFVERLGQNLIDGKCSVYAWVRDYLWPR
jgi:putative transposase